MCLCTLYGTRPEEQRDKFWIQLFIKLVSNITQSFTLFCLRKRAHKHTYVHTHTHKHTNADTSGYVSVFQRYEVVIIKLY